MKIKKSIIVILILLIPMSLFARWKPPTEWTYDASYSKVYAAAKALPKTLPMKLIKATKGQITFKGDWGAMDIPKDNIVNIKAEGKKTKVEVAGCGSQQAYRILRAIGDTLKQPLPPPPKAHRN